MYILKEFKYFQIFFFISNLIKWFWQYDWKGSVAKSKGMVCGGEDETLCKIEVQSGWLGCLVNDKDTEKVECVNKVEGEFLDNQCL